MMIHEIVSMMGDYSKHLLETKRLVVDAPHLWPDLLVTEIKVKGCASNKTDSDRGL